MRRTILLLALLVLTTGAAWRRGDAYMLHAGKTDVTMMGGMPVSEVPALHRPLGDTSYLWVRLGTREWLIRDETLLREATALWAPIQALEPEQHGLGEEERRLDRRIDAIEDGKAKADPGELARLRQRYEGISRRERELDQRSEAMEKVVEAKLRQLVDEAIRDGRAKELR
jgi:hypothetical protein